MTLGVLELLILVGVAFGVLTFLRAIIDSHRARSVAAWLLGSSLFALGLYYASFRAIQSQQAAIEGFPNTQTILAETRARNQRLIADAKARVNSKAWKAIAQSRTYSEAVLNEINQMRVDLEKLGDAELINDPPLRVVKEAPDWGERPKADYKHDSDFAKQLYAETGADWLVIKRPRSKRGLDRCLALERWVIREKVREYVAARSRHQLGKENALAKDTPLGMDDAEIYRRFVKHRQLVEKNGEHTIYTMIVIKNKEGGDELVEKTLALGGNLSLEPPNETSKPDWVTNPPKNVGNIVRLSYQAGPFSTVDECRTAGDGQLMVLASNYAEGRPPSTEPPSDPYRTHSFNLNELRRRLVRDEHVETREMSFGDMVLLHTLVEITPEDGRWLTAQRQQAQQDEHLGFVALVAGVVLALVAGAFALLKLDEATRGYYSKRLLIGVPMALLALVATALILLV